jgi:hypothetical protein
MKPPKRVDRPNHDLTPERRSIALRLLASQEHIPRAIARRRWTELTALRDFMGEGLAVAPGKPVSAELSRQLRQRAEIYNSGHYARALDALADKNNDATAGALLRGLAAREKLATEEGGAMSALGAAKLLCISTSAVLRRARLYRLVAWRDWRKAQVSYRFPLWQFRGNTVLPGIREVLQVFKTWHRWIEQRDDWGVVLFFLASRISLGGKRPLDLLRIGETDRAVELAAGDDAPIDELAQGVRRLEELQAGKVRGLTEAEFRKRLDEGSRSKRNH